MKLLFSCVVLLVMFQKSIDRKFSIYASTGKEKLIPSP
jgi:hypothetical protein